MGKKYRDRWYVDGKERQVTYDSKAELEKGRAKRKFGGPSTPTGKPVVSTTFKELAKSWIENYAKLSKAPGQSIHDRSAIRAHLEPVFGDVKLTDLNEGHLKAVRVEMQRKGRAPKTIKNVLALAKAILNMATESQDGSPPPLSASPFAKVKLGRIGKQPFAYWTPDERDAFIRFCRQHDEAFAKLVTVACFTGMRRGELAGLQRYQLDFDQRLIQVSASYNFMVRERLNRTKSGDAEWVPMNDAAYEALKDKRLLAPTDQVFVVCNRKAAKKLARYAKRFGVRPIRFHDLRHTFASCLAMAGVPLYDIQKLMRHKEITMTQRYAHLSPQHLHGSSNALCGEKGGPNAGHDSGKSHKLVKEQEESWWAFTDLNRKNKSA